MFCPIRREIARRTLEILVTDGRIQPPRIEEVYSKCTKELENEIREEGEKAVFETGIGKIHPELIKLMVVYVLEQVMVKMRLLIQKKLRS